MKNYKNRVTAAALSAVIAAICTACGAGTVTPPSDIVGVGRPAELVGSGADSPTPAVDEPIDTETEPDGTDGAGDAAVTDGNGGADNADNTDNTDKADSGKTWELVDGKYTYNFRSPDRSGLSDLTDIYNTGRGLFPDQGDDSTGSWYFGKTTYNEATGEVTYVYDRYDATKQLLADNMGIYRGDESRKVCYFTFDCGYENGYTAPILDTLRDKQVAGVFFLTGHYVDTAKDQIRRMIDEGQILGNHTVDHPNMTQVATPEDFIAQITGLEDMVKDAFPDAMPILYYRPPYGAANEWTLKIAKKLGIHTVEWSFTYADYDPDNQLDYATALQKCKDGLHPGAVYLFHAVSKTNSEILGEFIDWVRAQGYEILPICDIG